MAVTSPFGSRTRTRLLMVLELLGQSYPRELARLLGSSLSAAQKGLASLERDGLVAGRLTGRTRLFQLNPGYFAAKEVRALLARLTEADRELESRASMLRRRPRRTGKRL
jgi:DNA-binding transcriptional ArsR family regulator